MYSYEILNYLRQTQYELSVEEYFRILNTSPQINRVTYNKDNNDFTINTDDLGSMTFKVKKRGN